MDHFKVIAFTHKNLSLEEVGKFHLEDAAQQKKLEHLKLTLNITELMYVSTCNRVEFFIITPTKFNTEFISQFFHEFNPSWNKDEVREIIKSAEIYENEDAVKHVFNVASSLDSMVVGEREIITQIRKAYENSKAYHLTGDFIRLLVKHTLETAKLVYTETDIAKNPVSIVSLAYRELLKLNVNLDAKILVIGAGKTNKTMSNFLWKHGYKDFTVFNRSFSNAEELAKEIQGKAYPLSKLSEYQEGFDVLLTCTASQEHIITAKIYEQLLGNDDQKKVVIDLAIPNDFDESIVQTYPVSLIQVASLKRVASENIKIREKELVKCHAIIDQRMKVFTDAYRTRQIELAMSDIPRKVKEIHQKAISEVFAKDIETLDESSKQVLDRVMAYVEKKYISVPMKMAKEILMEDKTK